jgi:hypothetical protein
MHATKAYGELAVYLHCFSVLATSWKAHIPVAARSKAWVYGRSVVGIVGSNPAGDMYVCCDCCVLSGRGLCDGPMTRPEEFYRVLCV